MGADDDLQAEHAQYRELADSVKDVDPSLPNIPGNDETYTEYGGGRQQQRGEPDDDPANDARRYDQQHARQPEQQPQRQEQQYQQPQRLGPPDVQEDPIGFFEHQNREVREYLQGNHAYRQEHDFWSALKDSEDHARSELPDYDQAIGHLTNHRQQEIYAQFPDTRQSLAVAHQYGYRSPAELRQAIFRQDAITLANQAAQQGQSPAMAYYNMALQRGHVPRQAMTTTFAKNAHKYYDNMDDKTEEQFWREYKYRTLAAEAASKMDD